MILEPDRSLSSCFSDYDLPPLETETGDLNSEKEGSGEVSSFYKKIKEKIELGDMGDKEKKWGP